jgi:hypothetical protein
LLPSAPPTLAQILRSLRDDLVFWYACHPSDGKPGLTKQARELTAQLRVRQARSKGLSYASGTASRRRPAVIQADDTARLQHAAQLRNRRAGIARRSVGREKTRRREMYPGTEGRSCSPSEIDINTLPSCILAGAVELRILDVDPFCLSQLN